MSDGKVVNIDEARFNPRKCLAQATEQLEEAEIVVVLTLNKDGKLSLLHSEAHTADLTHILKFFDMNVTEAIYHENYIDDDEGGAG